MSNSRPALKNRFSQNEWTGALGDLGTLLPLAFAIVIYNGFSPNIIFFLWGTAYVITGSIFKIPLSVQPLKVMTVIAISQGLSQELLTSTAFFYGILFLIISLTGAIKWLQKWFSTALVTGIQLGIGMVLGKKAIELILGNGIFLSLPGSGHLSTFTIFAFILIIFWMSMRKKKVAVGVTITVLASLLLIFYLKPQIPDVSVQSLRLGFTLPDLSLLINATILLMIPQLPLTLGNSIFAAADTSHQLWGSQSRRVTPTRLGYSVGFSNVVIGLLGGFPMCHGAGGMAAHAQFGAKTGGATIIIGGVLILLAMVSSFTTLAFLIPVPVLAALLVLDGWRMVSLISRLTNRIEFTTAIIVGGLTVITGNLSIALISGLISERLLTYYNSKINTKTTEDES